jgi:hypothetical protein
VSAEARPRTVSVFAVGHDVAQSLTALQERLSYEIEDGAEGWDSVHWGCEGRQVGSDGAVLSSR